MSQPRVVVIGAGIGGLTAAALLLRQGWQVTVLEAATYPGGCAGTFFHKGYRFDAGATLAGGFDASGPHTRVAELLDLRWDVSPADPAWVVHLPDRSVTQWADPARWHTERQAHFPNTESFWRLQERLADLTWDIASRDFPFPPANVHEALRLPLSLRAKTLGGLPHLLRKFRALLPPNTDAAFKAFIDAQLLISAQAISDHANALYGATVLDLPRRGVVHVHRGMGGIAETLVDWIHAHGGEVKYRQKVERIEVRNSRAVAVHTGRGLRLEADAFLANVTPWGLRNLLSPDAPADLERETRARPDMWGAAVLHVGLDARMVDTPITHHQVIMDVHRPLGEGNSVFISLSPLDDPTRAPAGRRTATLSTHTSARAWHNLLARDPQAYAAQKEHYTDRMLAAAERALPGFRRAAQLVLPGTPVTYAFYTRRPLGMVGGFPQVSLLAARSPRTGIANLWQVGDSIFPGQSTAGVTLGALRVARLVQDSGLGRRTLFGGVDVPRAARPAPIPMKTEIRRIRCIF